MNAVIPLLLTLVTPPPQVADSIVPVERGMRLDVRNQSGEIRIDTWNRNEVRVQTVDDEGAFTVEQSGSVVRVRPAQGRWRRERTGRGERFEWDENDDGYARFVITVPAYLDLSLRGVETSIVAHGVGGNFSAETVEGAIDVTGGNGTITLHTQEQDVRLENARGRIRIRAGDGDVTVHNVVGELSIEGIESQVHLQGVESALVEVRTVEGDITFEGPILDDGRYRIASHDGNVTLVVPSGTNATVVVTTYDGSFETSFPVTLRESRRRSFQFVLGSGRSEVTLETFDGDIFLRRAN